jgi:hypothetical protein
MPGDPDALLQLRLVLLMASPFLCCILIFSYFGRVLKVTWWRKPTFWMSVSYALVSAVALGITLLPGNQMQGPFRSWFFILAGLLTTLYLLGLVFALNMMLQPLGRFSEENFSNPDDFPQQYAKTIIYLPFLHLLMSWSATFNGRLPVMSFALVMLSVLSVIILLGALSPHRALEVERLEAELEAEQKARQQEPELLSAERKEEILQAIRLRVEEEQAYLDNHLTLSKLSQLCGFNRTYVSGVLNESLAAFSSMSTTAVSSMPRPTRRNIPAPTWTKSPSSPASTAGSPTTTRGRNDRSFLFVSGCHGYHRYASFGE